MIDNQAHAYGVDNIASRTHIASNLPFGRDDDGFLIPIPDPALGLGYFNQALLGHSPQAPKLQGKSPLTLIKSYDNDKTRTHPHFDSILPRDPAFVGGDVTPPANYTFRHGPPFC